MVQNKKNLSLKYVGMHGNVQRMYGNLEGIVASLRWQRQASFLKSLGCEGIF